MPPENYNIAKTSEPEPTQSELIIKAYNQIDYNLGGLQLRLENVITRLTGEGQSPQKLAPSNPVDEIRRPFLSVVEELNNSISAKVYNVDSLLSKVERFV
jgi:hypothetical protein